MWIRRKKLEEMLLQAGAQPNEERESRLIEKLLEAMSNAFGVTLQAQAGVIQQHSDFISKMSEISAKRAAVVMGRKGGTTTQARRRQKLLGNPESHKRQCRYCRGDRMLTPADIDFHRQHEAQDNPEPETSPPRTIGEIGSVNGDGGMPTT